MASKRSPSHDSVPEGPAIKRKCTSQVQTTLHKFFPSEGEKAGPSTSSQTITLAPESYGIHMFTEDQIDRASGLERDYLHFWNSKARELCRSKEARSKLGNKVAIQGAITASWALHKTHLLQLQAEELCNEMTVVYRNHDPIVREKLLDVVQKNKQKMLDIHAEIEYTCGEFQGRDRENIVSEKLTELKKAQDALSKAINRRQKDVDAYAISENASKHTADEAEEISESELDAMVHEIKVESSLPSFEPFELALQPSSDSEVPPSIESEAEGSPEYLPGLQASMRRSS